MADYYPLIAKAVAGLEKNTGEGRRILYERARDALVAQLRSVTPALSESDITRERLALEEAIRKVEADAARRARGAPVTTRSERRAGATAEQPEGASGPSAAAAGAMDMPQGAADGGAGTSDEADQTADAPLPRRHGFTDQPSLKDQGLRGFRDVVAEAEGSGEAAEPASESVGETFAATEPTEDADRIEPQLKREELRPIRRRLPPRPLARETPVPPPREGTEPRKSAPPNIRETGRPEPPPLPRSGAGERADRADPVAPWFGGGRRSAAGEPGPVPGARREPDSGRPSRAEPTDLDFAPRDKSHPPFRFDEDDEEIAGAERPFPLRREQMEAREGASGSPRTMVGAGIGRVVVVAAAIVAVVLGLSGLVYWQWPMIAGLFTGSKVTATTPATPQTTPPPSSKITDRIGTPATGSRPQEGATVAQRVVLYEEDPDNPKGKRYVGTAIWTTEQVASGPGQPPDIAVRAEIEIPEPKITVQWSLRRNTDKALPASHTIEIVFSLPPDFPNGSVSNIPGVLMKQAEQTRGVPLAGLAVKVTDGFFLIGLSSAATDVKRNIQLLKERAWVDMPVVYSNGRRAIVAIEKGTPGERAFAEAFAAWGE